MCHQPVGWQGGTDGSLRSEESALLFPRRDLGRSFHFTWLKADAVSLSILINAVAFLAVYFARADSSVSGLGALPEHLPGDWGAGNSKLAGAAKFPLQKHEAQSKNKTPTKPNVLILSNVSQPR